MTALPRSLRRRVAAAAGHRCGYCLTPQHMSGAQMHAEHIWPLSQGGASDETNLWLACAWCNSYKGARTQAVDPQTGVQAPLFNPRTQAWVEHFAWRADGVEIIGLTPTGRATVQALHLNNEYIVPARRQWQQAGWRPVSEGTDV